MIHNTQKILDILREGLEREENLLNEKFFGDFDLVDRTNRTRQEGVISGIGLAMDWIENNITQK